jgi:YteA family regulatory protein
MKKERCDFFREKLIKEKQRINSLLNLMVKNETIDSKSEISSELSFYDNHPSDIATELSDIERGMAFKENEKSILKKIDNALDSINKGSYGICKVCKKEINEQRLEFIPYAECCIECQNKQNSLKQREIYDRPVEEEVLGYPFGKGYNSYKYDTEFDAEDSYRAVERFNEIDNIEEYYEPDADYVEPIEKISNEQYKNQLPD